SASADQSARQPGIPLMNDTHAIVTSCIIIQNLTGFVSRAVVHDDKLKLYSLLRQDAVHGNSKIRSAVVNAHHNRYLGLPVHALKRSKRHAKRPIARHPTKRAHAP